MHLNRLIAEYGGRTTIGPVELVSETNRSAYLDSMVKKHWSPEMEMRTSIDELKLDLKRAIRTGLIAQGRLPGQAAAEGCAALLVELGMP